MRSGQPAILDIRLRYIFLLNNMTLLKPMNSYLMNRHQRVKISNSQSLWKLIKYGVSKRSILGPVLSNIFLCDLFFIIDDVDIASQAENNTQYTHRKRPNKVLEKLEYASRNIFEWFFNNTMKASPDKCHFLSSLEMNTKISVSSFNIENKHSQKLIGVTIDHKLNFHDHVSNLPKKASSKISVMANVFLLML